MRKVASLLVQIKCIQPLRLVKVSHEYNFFTIPNLDCPDYCTKCDADKCFACEETYLLYNKGCVSKCPERTYSTGTTCESEYFCEMLIFKYFFQGCLGHCDKCDADGCLVCEEKYLLYNKGCVLPPCPAKTYSTGKICESEFYQFD